MNYTETPICGEPMREVPMREALGEIEKKLTETSSCLTEIIENIIGTQRQAEKAEVREERCMHDQICIIETLTDDVMVMAHRIKELMF